MRCHDKAIRELEDSLREIKVQYALGLRDKVDVAIAEQEIKEYKEYCDRLQQVARALRTKGSTKIIWKKSVLDRLLKAPEKALELMRLRNKKR